MTTATSTPTVRDFLNRHGDHDLHGDERLAVDLVSWEEKDSSRRVPDTNFLRLIEQSDGRIDLVDYNCSDTGCDFSGEDVSVLKAQVDAWLEAIGAAEPDSDDDSQECVIFPLD